jgi:UDP-glucose:(heptosyl)LPS alpha-1,3-glucosyltransferase
MAPIYARADVFVLPSSYETFSLVTFEAAAAGLPLLVTRVSGVEEILEDDVTGWGITQDGHDIANRLRLLSNDRVRLRLGAAARTAAARYSWDRMVEQYIALYRELANEPR